MEGAGPAGTAEQLPLRLEGWPAATLPQPSRRALEIARGRTIPTAPWKTLRVSHTHHSPGDGG